jgi:hypothetical protein
MSVTAIVKLTSLPGQRDALVSAMAPAVEATRAQPACLAADLLAGIENPVGGHYAPAGGRAREQSLSLKACSTQI